MTAPHAPPLTIAADLPPLVLAPGLDAFRVDEVPLYEPSGEGPHWYVRVQKAGVTTREAVRRIARAAGVKPRDIGTAGQKDKYAVTTQWMSVPENASAPDTWELGEDMSVVAVSRHRNKLKTGHVQANTFTLTFAGDAAAAEAGVRGVLDVLERDGLANYYGRQRFGRGGQNLERALAWARGEARVDGKDRRFKTTLYASVLQSEVFNRYVSARRANDATLLPGEVVRLDGSRSVFVVEDPAAEAPRLQSGDIRRTGPMVGPKARAAEGEAAVLEDEALASLELGEEDWRRVAKFAPGTRRDLEVVVENISCELTAPDRIAVTFTLPSGSYATQLAREITRRPWASPLAPPAEDG